MDSQRELEVIRDEMEQTRSSLADKLGALEEQVRDTVSTASETVATTVEGVKEVVTGVSETVGNVTETLNVSKHVEQHPWAAMGIAVAAGFVVSRLLAGSGRPYYLPPDWQPRQPSQEQTTAPAMGQVMGEASDRGASHHAPQQARREQPQQQQPAQQGPTLTEQAAALLPALSSFVPDLGAKASAFLPELDKLVPEIEKLGNTVSEGLGQLAVGGLMCVVRELAADALPESWKGEVTKIVDDLTVQLGGKPQQLKDQEKQGQNGQQQQGQPGQHDDKQGGQKDKQGGQQGQEGHGAQRGRREKVGQS